MKVQTSLHLLSCLGPLISAGLCLFSYNRIPITPHIGGMQRCQTSKAFTVHRIPSRIAYQKLRTFESGLPVGNTLSSVLTERLTVTGYGLLSWSRNPWDLIWSGKSLWMTSRTHIISSEIAGLKSTLRAITMRRRRKVGSVSWDLSSTHVLFRCRMRLTLISVETS